MAGMRTPDPAKFLQQHQAYAAALRAAGVEVTVLPALEQFPDSVFVEDAALCAPGTAITLRAGAATRRGEAAAIRPHLGSLFDTVIDLPGEGSVDGGDVLLTDEEAFVGLSKRTDEKGCQALSSLLRELGYRSRIVQSPPEVLHFKSDCGLLDSDTIFATRRLAATGCFSDYRVIEAPPGEEAAANLVRVNDVVLLRTGFPRTEALLRDSGFSVTTLATEEAALIDGGLSCMSLRFSLS
jgi:dimethylargininase